LQHDRNNQGGSSAMKVTSFNAESRTGFLCSAQQAQTSTAKDCPPSSFASQVRADDIQGLGNRQDSGARIHSALYDVLEKIRRAPVRSGSSADVMGGKYEPSPGPTILPNGFFDERWLLSTLLE